MASADMVRGGLLGLVLVACLATSAPPRRPPRPFVAWRLDVSAPVQAGCLRARGWVSKSGKTGVGITLRLENTTGVPCAVTRVDAEFRAGVGGPALTPIRPLVFVDGTGQPSKEASAIPACQVRLVYLGFPFDNDAAWRAGLTTGAFTARLAADGAEVTFAATAHQGAVQLEGHDRFGSEPPPPEGPSCAPAQEPAP